MKIINADHLMERLNRDPIGRELINDCGLKYFIKDEPEITLPFTGDPDGCRLCEHFRRFAEKYCEKCEASE